MSDKKTKVTPADFFLYLALFVSLYVSAISFISLWFAYINIALPEGVGNYYLYNGYESGLKMAMSALIVSFLLFLILSRVVNNRVRRTPERRDLWVRKWLLYLTLFVAGATAAIDLVVALNSFLGGDITTRFVLKVVSVLVVSVAIFLYYLLDIRDYWQRREKASIIYGVATLLVVLISLILAFIQVGSPNTNRMERYDEQKVKDLQSVQWQVIDYWRSKEELPTDLSDLEDSLGRFDIPIDPQTGEDYEYNRVGNLEFELCADFNTQTPAPLGPGQADSETLEKPLMAPEAPSTYDRRLVPQDNWAHDEGRHCFLRTIDPELYPTLKD